MMRRRSLLVAALSVAVLVAAVALLGTDGRSAAVPSQPVRSLPVEPAPRAPAPAVTLVPWSGPDLPERDPPAPGPVPGAAAPPGPTALPAGDPARDDTGDGLLRDIARRSGRPADPDVGSVVALWRAGRSKEDLLQAARRIADPLSRVMVDGWIRDRFDPPRGPAALGAGGASVHIPAVQPVH